MIFSGSSLLASFWHWSYWYLNVFTSRNLLSWTFIKCSPYIFSWHQCFVKALLRIWFSSLSQVLLVQVGLKQTSDSFGIVGSIRCVKPAFNLIGLAAFCYGVISAHHISAGLLGMMAGIWHISSRPGVLFYKPYVSCNVNMVGMRSWIIQPKQAHSYKEL